MVVGLEMFFNVVQCSAMETQLMMAMGKATHGSRSR